MKSLALLAIAACALAPAQTADDPERAVRQLLFALYANDNAAFQMTILPAAGSESLIGTRTFTQDQRDKLRSDINVLRLRHEPSLWNAERRIYSTSFRGVPFGVPMQRTPDGWKGDVRYWLAMRRQRDVRPQLGDPEMIAKGFLFHILAKKPEMLNTFTVETITGEDYTAANNLPPGDLDHILSLCIEMPVVRERVDADSMLLLGLMGTTEIPFEMKRAGGAWKIVPRRYFEMLRKAGAI